VQIAFTGMLGEYVTAIHAQVRRGPAVVEQERINIAEAPASFRQPEASGLPEARKASNARWPSR
jgi:hypothetical protein